MNVPPTDAAATTDYHGHTYQFCSTDCQTLFDAAPATHVDTPHPHLVDADGTTIPRLPYGRAGGEFDLSIADPTALCERDSVRFTKTVADDDVRKFAEATGDTNAVHLNDAFAATTRFGHRIVHGTLVAGLISAALACFPGLTIYIAQDLTFHHPVVIDESVTAVCTIAETLGNDRYRLSTAVENGAGDVVLDGTATVLIDPLPPEFAGA